MGLLCLAAAAAAFTARPCLLSSSPAFRATSVRLFEETSELPSAVTRKTSVDRKGSVVVTDGTDNLYASRTLFPVLHDFGRFKSIVAHGKSIVENKKALLTRQARYGGLLDVLSFAEGPLAEAFDGADTWVAINADEAVVAANIDAAVAAGVSRVVVLLTGDGPTVGLADSKALEAKLSGVDYTVIRTGELAGESVGGGLKLADVDVPTCEDVSKGDVFRFVTEVITMPEASNRLFSLCPSEGTESTLKQLRLSGYERRDEYQLLLSSKLLEPEAETDKSEEQVKEEQELVLRTEAELAAERESELKALVAKAKARGEAQQRKLEYEEKEKAIHRKEQEKYYKSPLPKDDDDITPPITDSDADEGDKPADGDAK